MWEGLGEFWSKCEDRMGHLSNQWELRVSRLAPFGAESGRCAYGRMPLINIVYQSGVVLLKQGETLLFVEDAC